MALLLAVIFGSFVAGSAMQAGAAPVGTTVAGCAPAQDCGHGAGSVSGQPSQSPAPCVQRVACGGGAALAFGGFVLVAVLFASHDLVSGTPSRWTIRYRIASVVDRLSAGRLFRPPRLSF